MQWDCQDTTIPGTGELLPGDAVCLLDVPVNKTGTAFTKPVDRLVGEVSPSAHDFPLPLMSRKGSPYEDGRIEKAFATTSSRAVERATS
jgi:hypothetical protein